MIGGLVDTHAHLDGTDFHADLAEVVRRARDAGVAAIISAGQDEATSRAALCLSERFESIAPAVGVHPHLAADAGALNWLETLAGLPGVVAIGEIGLDYHYDFAPREVQRDVFARQLDLAAARGLPVVMHCREAEEDLLAILRGHFDAAQTGVVHCFTGSYEMGVRFIEEFSVFLGIGGAVTFKKADQLHDAVARLPLERLVLETDCPFMTPAPHRGKRNEPAYLPLTCRRVAELRGAPETDIAAATTANAWRLFPKLATR
mgnify:CR=1 FL=1